MKKLLLLLILFISSCTTNTEYDPSLKEYLQGTWQVKDSTDYTISFSNDGLFIVKDSIQGTYMDLEDYIYWITDDFEDGEMYIENQKPNSFTGINIPIYGNQTLIRIL